jgi:hypothetical protein
MGKFLTLQRDARTSEYGFGVAMRLFYRRETTIRCAFRSPTLVVPTPDRIARSCAEAQRERLHRQLAKIPTADRIWSVQWRKRPGNDLRPGDLVAVLRLGDITVELAAAQRGVLAEILGTEGKAGARLANIAKPPEMVLRTRKLGETLATYEARHRHDVDQIRTLQGLLAEQQKLADHLRAEILGLRARQAADHLASPRSAWAGDAKFRRLKQEFSKHFHPDMQTADDLDRKRRERVFQEFWPIVEQIERF